MKIISYILVFLLIAIMAGLTGYCAKEWGKISINYQWTIANQKDADLRIKDLEEEIKKMKEEQIKINEQFTLMKQRTEINQDRLSLQRDKIEFLEEQNLLDIASD